MSFDVFVMRDVVEAGQVQIAMTKLTPERLISYGCDPQRLNFQNLAAMFVDDTPPVGVIPYAEAVELKKVCKSQEEHAADTNVVVASTEKQILHESDSGLVEKVGELDVSDAGFVFPSNYPMSSTYRKNRSFDCNVSPQKTKAEYIAEYLILSKLAEKGAFNYLQGDFEFETMIDKDDKVGDWLLDYYGGQTSQIRRIMTLDDLRTVKLQATGGGESERMAEVQQQSNVNKVYGLDDLLKFECTISFGPPSEDDADDSLEVESLSEVHSMPDQVQPTQEGLYSENQRVPGFPYQRFARKRQFYSGVTFPLLPVPVKLVEAVRMNIKLKNDGVPDRNFGFPDWAKPHKYMDCATNSIGQHLGDENYHIMGNAISNSLKLTVASKQEVVMNKMVISGRKVLVYCDNDRVIQTAQRHMWLDLANVKASTHFTVVTGEYIPYCDFFNDPQFVRMFREVKSVKISGLYHMTVICALLAHLHANVPIDVDMMDLQYVNVGRIFNVIDVWPKVSNFKFNAVGTDAPHGLDVLLHVQSLVNRMRMPFETLVAVIADVPLVDCLKSFLEEFRKCVAKSVTIYLVHAIDAIVYAYLIDIGFVYQGVEMRQPLKVAVEFVVFKQTHEDVTTILLFPVV